MNAKKYQMQNTCNSSLFLKSIRNLIYIYGFLLPLWYLQTLLPTLYWQTEFGTGCARSIWPTRSEILYQLRDIYSTCMIYLNGATYKWKVHNGKIEIISFGLHISLSTSPHCNFLGSFGIFKPLLTVIIFLSTCTINATGNANPSGAPDITSGFVWSLYYCCLSLVEFCLFIL